MKFAVKSITSAIDNNQVVRDILRMNHPATEIMKSPSLWAGSPAVASIIRAMMRRSSPLAYASLQTYSPKVAAALRMMQRPVERWPLPRLIVDNTKGRP